MNSNLVIMNRVRSVTVFSHTSTARHADGKGDELLFSFYLSSLSSFSLSLPLSLKRSGSLHLFPVHAPTLGYLIIILSAARAWLIDVPLNCLLQADDLTKALCST